VHENDPERHGCEFSHFFESTPQSLIDAGIYKVTLPLTLTLLLALSLPLPLPLPQFLPYNNICKTIANALHPSPHREVRLPTLTLPRPQPQPPNLNPTANP
jgi:hypothetical protein